MARTYLLTRISTTRTGGPGCDKQQFLSLMIVTEEDPGAIATSLQLILRMIVESLWTFRTALANR